MPLLWIATLAALGLAALAGVADRRRNERDDLDRVGFMPWPLILILALLAAAVLAALALQ